MFASFNSSSLRIANACHVFKYLAYLSKKLLLAQRSDVKLQSHTFFDSIEGEIDTKIFISEPSTETDLKRHWLIHGGGKGIIKPRFLPLHKEPCSNVFVYDILLDPN